MLLQLYAQELDGTPRANEVIQLCMFVERSTFKWRSWDTDNVLACRNHTSDGEGVVAFSLPPFSQRVTGVIIQVGFGKPDLLRHFDNIH